MAINENGYLRGQIGNLVNRKVGTKNIVQTKPGHKIRQRPASKAAAKDFGTASSAAGLIRHNLSEVHQDLHDNKLHNRLVVQLQRVMRATKNPMLGDKMVEEGGLNRLVGFQFNANCHLHDYVFFDPVLSLDETKQLSVSFPSFDRYRHLRIPKACNQIVLRLTVDRFSFVSNHCTMIGSQELSIPLYGKNNQEPIDAQTWHFDCSSTKKGIILVALSVLYLHNDGSPWIHRYNTKELHPAGIIGAFTL